MRLLLEKYMFVSHTKTYIRKITDLLHSQLITCITQISEYKNKRVYFGAVKFKTKD